MEPCTPGMTLEFIDEKKKKNGGKKGVHKQGGAGRDRQKKIDLYIKAGK